MDRDTLEAAEAVEEQKNKVKRGKLILVKLLEIIHPFVLDKTEKFPQLAKKFILAVLNPRAIKIHVTVKEMQAILYGIRHQTYDPDKPMSLILEICKSIGLDVLAYECPLIFDAFDPATSCFDTASVVNGGEESTNVIEQLFDTLNKRKVVSSDVALTDERPEEDVAPESEEIALGESAISLDGMQNDADDGLQSDSLNRFEQLVLDATAEEAEQQQTTSNDEHMPVPRLMQEVRDVVRIQKEKTLQSELIAESSTNGPPQSELDVEGNTSRAPSSVNSSLVSPTSVASATPSTPVKRGLDSGDDEGESPPKLRRVDVQPRSDTVVSDDDDDGVENVTLENLTIINRLLNLNPTQDKI